jgi:hypothetical protein
MIRAQTGAILNNGELVQTLIKENDELWVEMAQLAIEVEVMTTTADNWQTRANTVEMQLEDKIAGLEAWTKLQIARISERQDKAEETI